MIVSMTGFGDATAERDGTHYAVEIRSLNNRFFKAVIKLPDNVSGLEPELETMLREQLGRGSITYILKTRSQSAEAAYLINTQALDAYLEQLQKLKSASRGNLNIDLGALLQLPGVCQEPRDESDEIERHGQTIRELTAKAVIKLNTMRAREGEALFRDLMKHLTVISTNLSEIAKRAPFVIDDYHKRLTQRVNTLISKAELTVNQTDLTSSTGTLKSWPTDGASTSDPLQITLGSGTGGYGITIKGANLTTATVTQSDTKDSTVKTDCGG